MTRLADIFPDSSHVQCHSLTEADDSEIWEFAKVQGFCIVTQDDDGSKETIFWNTQKQGVNEEIVSVFKDDERKQMLVVYDDGSRENIFWGF
ncbi:DUF5615 family PIN-like protein [Microcoleus sp. ZQ-A2]